MSGAPSPESLKAAALPANPIEVRSAGRTALRAVYFAAGLILTALGIVGAFLPLMPTTIFLILAAWCFARSSPRLERWLLTHPQFGPVLIAWQREKAIARRAKIMACTGMTLGFVLFLIGARPGLALMAAVFLGLAACAAYVISRPEPSQARAGAMDGAEQD